METGLIPKPKLGVEIPEMVHSDAFEHLYSPIAVENKSENRINTT